MGPLGWMHKQRVADTVCGGDVDILSYGFNGLASAGNENATEAPAASVLLSRIVRLLH